MRDSFDTGGYVRALAQAWKRALVCVAGAAAVALVAGLLTTPQYEANVLVLIQLPPSAQAFPTAMNPAYFEYLRGFEQSFTADGLLSRLLHESKLDQPPHAFSPAAFRASIGRAILLRNTRMIKLSVVLPVPQAAHDVAVLWARLAEQTNARLGTAEIDAHKKRIGDELAAARQHLESLSAAGERLQREVRLDLLSQQVAHDIELKNRYGEELSRTRSSLAENESQAEALAADLKQEPERYDLKDRGQPSSVLNPVQQQLRLKLQAARAEAQGLRTRRDMLVADLGTLEARLAAGQVKLESAESKRRALDRDYKEASAAVDTLSTRASEAAIMAPRYESLEIGDAGAVPDRPVRPRIVVNMLVAAMLALLAAVFYETWRFHLRTEARIQTAAVPASLPRERIAVR